MRLPRHVYRTWIIFTIVDGRVDGFYIEKNGSPYANIETDEGRTFFLIGIPCHSEFLKEEEVVSTLSQPVSTLYQAWMQAMDEILKNSSTDTPERVLTLCINLVSTSVKPTRKAIDLWEKNNANLSVLNVLQILLIYQA